MLVMGSIVIRQGWRGNARAEAKSVTATTLLRVFVRLARYGLRLVLALSLLFESSFLLNWFFPRHALPAATWEDWFYLTLWLSVLTLLQTGIVWLDRWLGGARAAERAPPDR